jgi:hypothetical protein
MQALTEIGMRSEQVGTKAARQVMDKGADCQLLSAGTTCMCPDSAMNCAACSVQSQYVEHEPKPTDFYSALTADIQHSRRVARTRQYSKRFHLYTKGNVSL